MGRVTRTMTNPTRYRRPRHLTNRPTTRDRKARLLALVTPKEGPRARKTRTAISTDRQDRPSSTLWRLVEGTAVMTTPGSRLRTRLPTVTTIPKARMRARTNPGRSHLSTWANSCRRDKLVEGANKTTAPERHRRTGLPTVTTMPEAQIPAQTGPDHSRLSW